MNYIIWTDASIKPDCCHDFYPKVAYYVVDRDTKDVWGRATTIKEAKYKNTQNTILCEILAVKFALTELADVLLQYATSATFMVDNKDVRDWIIGDKKPRESKTEINEVVGEIHSQILHLSRHVQKVEVLYTHPNLADILMRNHT